MKNFEKQISSYWSIGKVRDISKVDLYSGKLWRVKTNKTYYLKKKESFAVAMREFDLLIHLKKNKIPVAVPMSTKNGQVTAQIDDAI